MQRLDMVVLELITRFVARGHRVDGYKYPVFAAGVIFDSPVVDACLKWRAVSAPMLKGIMFTYGESVLQRGGAIIKMVDFSAITHARTPIGFKYISSFLYT